MLYVAIRSQRLHLLAFVSSRVHSQLDKASMQQPEHFLFSIDTFAGSASTFVKPHAAEDQHCGRGAEDQFSLFSSLWSLHPAVAAACPAMARELYSSRTCESTCSDTYTSPTFTCRASPVGGLPDAHMAEVLQGLDLGPRLGTQQANDCPCELGSLCYSLTQSSSSGRRPQQQQPQYDGPPIPQQTTHPVLLDSSARHMLHLPHHQMQPHVCPTQQQQLWQQQQASQGSGAMASASVGHAQRWPA